MSDEIFPADDRVAELKRAIEAVVLVAQDPVAPEILAQLLEQPVGLIERWCGELAGEYSDAGRGFELVRVAGGYRYQTHADLTPYVERFVLHDQKARLSGAALETLAIIAYKQPISRAQVASIRGVDPDGVIRTLQARGYIGETGRDDGPGQAVLFGTTEVFLEKLGLDSLDDLPPIAEFIPGADVVETLEQGLRIDPGPDTSTPPANPASDADGSESDASESDAGETGTSDTDASDTDASDTDASDTDASDTDGGDTSAGETDGDGTETSVEDADTSGDRSDVNTDSAVGADLNGTEPGDAYPRYSVTSGASVGSDQDPNAASGEPADQDRPAAPVDAASSESTEAESSKTGQEVSVEIDSWDDDVIDTGWISADVPDDGWLATPTHPGEADQSDDRSDAEAPAQGADPGDAGEPADGFGEYDGDGD